MSTLLILCGLAAGTLPTARADDPPPLEGLSRAFSPAPPPAEFQPLPQSVEFTPVFVDTAYLELVEAGDWIALNTSPIRTFAARVDRVERRGPGRFSIVGGSLDGQEGTTFILVVEGDAVAGTVMSPAAQEHYKLRYAGPQTALVCRIDDGRYAPCAGADPAPPGGVNPAFDPLPDPDDGMTLPPEEGDDPFGGRGGCNAPQTVFDGMIAYSDNVRVAMGGASAVNAEIQLAVDVTNLVYAQSGVAARYRLVWRGEVNYSETSNPDTDLDRLTDPSDGYIDSLHTTRDSVNADMVTLWVDQMTDACGKGWCSADHDSAFQVVQWSCAADNFTQPHEMGHNQGCAHNPEDAGSCGEYSYSFGHRFFANSVGYRTVMSYDTDPSRYTRIGWFSNPNLTYLGQPLGTATRNNTATINNRRGAVEGWELTRMDIWVQFGWGGLQIGTYAFPYANMSTGVAQVAVPAAGASEDANLYIKAGTSTYTGTITKAMWIRACGGTVNIGGNP
jgi:hypothetical protein